MHAKEGETTKTGAQAETFGTGRAAQSEAGKKGGAISGAFVQSLVHACCMRPDPVLEHNASSTMFERLWHIWRSFAAASQ